MAQGARHSVAEGRPSGTAPAAGSPAPAVGSVPPRGRVLGFDLGSRRIGVAASDSDQVLALGVETVERSGDPGRDRHRLALLLEEYEAVGAVVGLPLTMAGAEGTAARAARAEMAELAGLVAIPIEALDERLSTVTAAAALRSGGTGSRRQRGVVDRTAAAVILQSWLDRRRSGATGG